MLPGVAWYAHAAAIHATHGNTFGVISGGDSKWGNLAWWTSLQFHKDLVTMEVARGSGRIGALFCLLASYGVMTGNTMAGALSIDPHRAGSASALMGTGSYGLGALASTLVAAVSDGSPAAFAAVMLICLGGSSSALFLLALPKERRPF